MKNLPIPVYLILLGLSLLSISCEKSNSLDNLGTYGCLTVIAPAYLKFNVVDKNSGQDLFFSAAPKYQITKLFLFKKSDKTRKDTIRPDVIGSGTTRYFKLSVNNGVKRDTLVFKIANNPDDELINTFKLSADRCPQYVLDNVYFNTVPLGTIQNKYVISK